MRAATLRPILKLRAAPLAKRYGGRLVLQGENRVVQHGYTGVDKLPVLPELGVVDRWSDNEGSEYLHSNYNSRIRKHYDSPGRPVNVTERTPLLRRLAMDLAQLEGCRVAGVLTYTTYAELLARAGVTGSMLTSLPTKMHSLDLAPGVRVYNACLQTLANFGKLDKMWAVRRMMRADGVQPDIYTYNAVMTLYLKRKEWDMVAETLKALLACGLSPIDITYDKVLAAANGPADARKYVKDMKHRNIALKPTHYVSMLAACMREPDPKQAVIEAERLIAEAEAESLGPTTQQYDALLAVYRETGQYEGMDRLLWERVDAKVPLSSHSYALYLSACAIRVQEKDDIYVQNAEKCFKKAITGSSHGFGPVYTQMLRVYTAARDVSKAEHLDTTLKGSLKHIRTSASFQLPLLRLYRDIGDTGKAQRVTASLKSRWRTLKYTDAQMESMLKQSPRNPTRTSSGGLKPIHSDSLATSLTSAHVVLS
eukprot:TRINITY_DN3545_c1_g1_i1.p1 TRINITY_DN3545_c1_g1~~TRINITY_DN3545_c1_g1_i1.p1  ORF type:complete len:481 (+),score=85.60 TRINITY_DN3545_c1_g1_i1:59-1501(+)